MKQQDNTQKKKQKPQKVSYVKENKRTLIEIWAKDLEVVSNKIRKNPSNKKREKWITGKMKLEGLVKGYKEAEKNYKIECKQWKETCEILADPEIRKSISISLRQFAEGKGIKLKDL